MQDSVNFHKRFYMKFFRDIEQEAIDSNKVLQRLKKETSKFGQKPEDMMK